MSKPKTGSRKKEQTRSSSGAYSSKLTRKQKAFADELINNPKISNAEAIKRTYNTTDTRTASAMAAENLNKPSILSYLEAHKEVAQENIVNLANNANNETVKLNANKDILDRTTGRAIQRQEITTTGLSINIDLSRALTDVIDGEEAE